MSDLRDRIAAALMESLGRDTGWEPESWREAAQFAAEVVIEKLGLHIERGERSKPDGILWARDNRYTVHRYVTYWKADDE